MHASWKQLKTCGSMPYSYLFFSIHVKRVLISKSCIGIPYFANGRVKILKLKRSRMKIRVMGC